MSSDNTSKLNSDRPITRHHRFIAARRRALELTRQFVEDPNDTELHAELVDALDVMDGLESPDTLDAEQRTALVEAIARPLERWLDRAQTLDVARSFVMTVDESMSTLETARWAVGHRAKHHDTYKWPVFGASELEEIAMSMAATFNAAPVKP